MSGKYCLDTTNYQQKRVVFLEKTRQKKAKKRPELRLNGKGKCILEDRIIEALKYPKLIYQNLSWPKERQVHYILEYMSERDGPQYTKVVVTKKTTPLYIITAFRPNDVKERGKTKLIFGEDN